MLIEDRLKELVKAKLAEADSNLETARSHYCMDEAYTKRSAWSEIQRILDEVFETHRQSLPLEQRYKHNQWMDC
jgi:hypothetical protein